MSPESSASAEGYRPRSPDEPSAEDPSAGGQGRAHFQQQLQELETHALGGLDLIVEQLDRVLEALEHQDVELAQMVIADDDRVDGRVVEVGPTQEIFTKPSDPRTEEYVTGKFG